MKIAVAACLATTLLACAPIAQAQSAQSPVRTEKNISLALASDVATEAVAACTAKGYTVSATVVDRAGLVKAMLRADNAGPHTLESSRRKAFTSASAKSNTSAIMENSQKNPAAAHLADIDGFLLLAGGVPIRSGNEVIGAVGVAGAPGGQFDEQCAEAALAKVKDRL